jgi:hypothetical protein
MFAVNCHIKCDWHLTVLASRLVKDLLQEGKGRTEAAGFEQKEMATRPYFPVTIVLMPPHEPRHTYEHVLFITSRSVSIDRGCSRPGGMFCTQRCFWQAWGAFRRAFAKGQLADILEMPVSQEVLNTNAPATRRRLSNRNRLWAWEVERTRKRDQSLFSLQLEIESRLPKWKEIPSFFLASSRMNTPRVHT